MASPPEQLIPARDIFVDSIWDHADRPFRLWGQVPPAPRVSIVGSRRASAHGLKAVRVLAKELAQAGVTVVSGGATGVDRAAHEGALDGGGQTLVMAPSGLDQPFPRQHEQLFLQIIEAGGGLLTHCVSGEKASRPQFLRRNAQMVALSDCIVLGEFPARSGSRNTWSHARRAGKAVFVLPSEFGQVGSAGSLEALEAAGSFPLGSTRRLLNFLQELGYFELSKTTKPFNSSGVLPNASKSKLNFLSAWANEHLSGVELKIYLAVLAGARTQDEVAEKLGISPLSYQSSVCQLQLEGCLGEDKNGLLSLLNPQLGR